MKTNIFMNNNTFKMPYFKFINTKEVLERVRNNQELLIQLLLNFKQQKNSIAKEIDLSIQNNSFKLARELTHNLKGESATIAAEQLHARTVELEKQLLNFQSSKNSFLTEKTFEYYLSNVAQELNNVINDIRLLETLLETPAKQETKAITEQETPLKQNPVDISTFNIQLEELDALLQQNNFKAKKLAKELNLGIHVTNNAAIWDQVCKAISILDFDLARKHLQKLIITR